MRDAEQTLTKPPWSSRPDANGEATVLGLTLLYHPELRRIGEIAVLLDRGATHRAAIGRRLPVFRKPSGPATGPLSAAQVSHRSPLLVTPIAGGIRLAMQERRMDVVVDGELLVRPTELTDAQLESGVVVVLAGTVGLLLHYLDVSFEPQPELGLVGHSRAIRELRAEILRVADRDVPVLLRGETGVGKELVAAALHQRSARGRGPYVCVNMAAIPASMAEAELFGYARGAYTGARQDRAGHFEMAHGGTLFLDEIGDASPEMQAKLLRVTEQNEIQPLGGATRRIDVRLVAATDSDLDRKVQDGAFRRPLLERMSGYVLRIPALRERIEDVPRLLLHFLAIELASQGEQARLEPAPGAPAWLPIDLMLRLLGHSWPGNVRELRNVAGQIAIRNRGSSAFRAPVPFDVEPSGSSHPDAARICPPCSDADRQRHVAKSARRLDEADVVAALERNAYNISRAARDLQISRTTLHTRINACALLHNAADFSNRELERVRSECHGDVRAMAARLKVSHRALVLRLSRFRRERVERASEVRRA